MPRGVYDRSAKKAQPMPNLSPTAAAAHAKKVAETGKYRLRPQIKASEAVAVQPPPVEKVAEPPVYLEPTPAGLIRMVHPEGATADGYRTDETGAVLVPWRDIEALKSHGFSVQHVHEIEVEDTV